MGWFRGRRKRRGAGTAGPASGAASDGRQASVAEGPDARGAADAADPAGAPFGQEPYPAAGTSVPDRIPWRHLEGGAYERLLGPLADAQGVSALLDYCALDPAWEPAVARALIDRSPPAGAALNRLAGKEEPPRAESAEFVGRVVRALSLLPAEEAVPLLVRLAEQKSGLSAASMPTARAAVRALAAVPGELVPPALHRLASESPLAALRRAAYAELKRRLHTLSDAPEWSVDTFGLDGAGQVRVPVGPRHVAVVRVAIGGKVQVRYHESQGRSAGDGRALAGRPTAATVDQDAVQGVTALATELRTAIRAARTRLESAQKERREIPVADWLEHYITHPVTGALARAVLWEVRAGGTEMWRLGLPKKVEERWGLVTEGGVRIVLQDGDVVRVAAPVRVSAAQARGWKQVLAQAKVQLVLKQIKPV